MPFKRTRKRSDKNRQHLVKGLLRWETLLFAAVVIGTFLRFYRIEENIVFHGELGHNYLAIKNAIASGKIPLLGPPTSHSWLSFGPLFYWIMAPILHMANYDPRAGAYFFAFLGAVTIVLNYSVIEKILNKRVAILSSVLMAISPAWLDLTRQARFFSLTAIFFYPFLYFFVKSLRENARSAKRSKQGKHLFWTGMFLGIMLNFHWSALALLPAVLTMLYFRRKRIRKENWTKGAIGMLIPNIPFLLFNIINTFSMLAKFIVWIPYRVAGFVGLYPKNTVSIQVIHENLTSFYDFFRLSFLADEGVLSLTLVFAVFLFILLLTINELRKKRKNWAWLALVSLLIWLYSALFVHGEPPRHYYVVIYALPIVFLSMLLDKLLRKWHGKALVVIVLITITVLNARFLFSKQWFYRQQGVVSASSTVPFDLQLLTAKKIIKDAKGRKFTLSRVGPFDEFDGDYAQNYQYLLWWLGNEPIETSSLKYTIYENTDRLPNLYEGRVYWIGNLAIVKEDKGVKQQ